MHHNMSHMFLARASGFSGDGTSRCDVEELVRRSVLCIKLLSLPALEAPDIVPPKILPRLPGPLELAKTTC